MQRISPRLERILAAGGLAAAFLVMASVFVPLDSGAAPRPMPMPHDHSSEAHSTDPHVGLPLLGIIEHGEYELHIYGGNEEPRYSIYNRDGERIGTLLRAEQVSIMLPEVDPNTMHFDVPGQLMYAETFGDR